MYLDKVVTTLKVPMKISIVRELPSLWYTANIIIGNKPIHIPENIYFQKQEITTLLEQGKYEMK